MRQPVVMNNTGSFGYYQADVNNEDTDCVINGTINVVNQPENPNISTMSSIGNLPGAHIDIVGCCQQRTFQLIPQS
jgi:hypothetical protein